MRTTVTLDDELLRSARARAGQLGLTLGQLVEQALRFELGRRDPRGGGPPVPVYSGGGGLRPGIDASSNRALLEAVDEDTPIVRLR